MTPEARQQIRSVLRIHGFLPGPESYALLAAFEEAEAFSATCSQIAREEESENSRLQQERDEKGKCYANNDGECSWSECPQLKEYKKWCPLATQEEER